MCVGPPRWCQSRVQAGVLGRVDSGHMTLPFSYEDLVLAHDDVLLIAREAGPTTEGLKHLKNYPNGWCSAMSYALIHLLRHRGLGSWRIAASGSHDWLEYVQNGDVVYSIDATQHQFHEYGPGRYIGPGLSPYAEDHNARQFAEVGAIPSSWAKGSEIALLAEVESRFMGDR